MKSEYYIIKEDNNEKAQIGNDQSNETVKINIVKRNIRSDLALLGFDREFAATKYLMELSYEIWLELNKGTNAENLDLDEIKNSFYSQHNISEEELSKLVKEGLSEIENDELSELENDRLPGLEDDEISELENDGLSEIKNDELSTDSKTNYPPEQLALTVAIYNIDQIDATIPKCK